MMNPYINLMRIDRPIGIFLLLWPTLWSLWLANNGCPPIKLLSIFILGSFVMRSAGCIINDFVDLKIDGKVCRTKNRALVSRRISKKQALSVLVMLLAVALYLVCQLNLLSLQLAILAMIFIVIYPFLKRYTDLVQFFLGFTFALGVPMAFAASNNHVPTCAWILYGINVVWIVAYDTIYAMIDKHDDKKIGVHSTAFLFGENSRILVLMLQSLVGCSLMVFGMILSLGFVYLVFVLLTFTLFIYQYGLTFTNNHDNYMTAFKNNNWVGLIIFLGFVFADYS
jgi:4-hydroxybenzoate polyprenyltransferase